MEIIKPLEDLAKPDSRSSMWEMVNPRTGARRSAQLEDHYRRFCRVPLNPGVPHNVRDALVVAANLYIYSWFVYTFAATAELHCLAALELALRERAGDGEDKTGPGLRKLMHTAIRENWIRDEGLPSLAPQLDENATVPAETEDPHAYVKHLANSLPNWRNTIAHGTSMVFPPGNMTLAVVVAIANQLWPAPNARH